MAESGIIKTGKHIQSLKRSLERDKFYKKELELNDELIDRIIENKERLIKLLEERNKIQFSEVSNAQN